MKAVVALTTIAAKLGERVSILEKDTVLYVPLRLRQEFPQAQLIQGSLAELVQELWGSYSQFVFVMAAGIVVRTIAPLLKGKTKDPAVVVLDEGGSFVIPLLSGHLGGANQLARELATAIGAQAVITTATDVERIPALDDLARRNQCVLENLVQWKHVALAMLEGKSVALFSSVDLAVEFPANVQVVRELKYLISTYEGMIYITEQLVAVPEGVPFVVLRPRNIVIGIGCRKGTSAKDISTAIREELKELALSPSSIAALASIDLKNTEPGLLEVACELGVSVSFYKSEELAQVNHSYATSPFVQEITGTGAVAEPAAWLAARDPLLLKGKTCYPGITIAIVKDQSIIID